jgi:hypothetical protein
VLQLNASYEPLRIITAKKALTLITKGIAVVEVPTSITIYPGIFLPSVIRLRFYHHVPTKLPVVSRKNILVRDGYRCMYCGLSKAGGDLELEHVIPKSRGGKNSWDNLVAACRKCNAKKDDKTPEEAGMKLIRRPLPANVHTPRFVLKAMGSEVKEWGRFLYGDSEGELKLVARG